MKWLKLTVIALIPIILLALGGSWYAILHTEPGARWLISTVQPRLPGKLAVQSISGDLGSGLTIQELVFSNDQVDVRAAALSLSLNVDVFPLRARIHSANIEKLELHLLDDGSREESKPVSLEDTLSALDLPLAISVSDAGIDGIVVTNAEDESLFAANRVEIALELADALSVSHLLILQENSQLTLAGELGLEPPYALDAQVSSQGEWLGESGGITDISAELTGDLTESLALALSSNDPEIRVDGSIEHLADQPRWILEIRSSQLQWPPGSPEQVEYAVNDLMISTEGWIDEYQLMASGQVAKLPGIDSLAFETRGKGDTTQFEVEHLALVALPVELTASGSLNWQDELTIALTTVLERLEPGVWLEDWPQQHPVAGRLEMNWDASAIELSMLELVLQGTGFELAGSSRFDLATEQIIADLEWQGFNWPPGGPTPDVSSPQGAIHLAGVVDAWNLEGSALLQAPGVPEGVLQVLAEGNRETALVELVEGQVLGGLIKGNAELDWRDGIKWSATIASSGIETERLVPEFPARIDAELSASGDTGQSRIEVEVHRLTGQYRSLPLAAQGRILLEQGVPSFTNFTASLDDSRVKLNGTPFDQAGLDFSGESPNLSILHAESAGSIRFDGNFSLPGNAPRLLLNLDGQDLRWGEYRAESLQVIERDQQQDSSKTNLDVVATQLVIAGQPLEQVNIGLSGDAQEQALSFELDSGGMSLSGAIRGEFVGDESTSPNAGWSGMLNSLKLSQSDRLALNLSEPASIEWSPSGGSLGEACLNVSSGTGKGLCLESEGVGSDDLAVTARLNQFPLSIIKPFLNTDLEFNQTIDGDLTWSSTAGNPGTGFASIDISPGELRYADDFDSLLKTGPGRISFNLKDGKLSEGRFELPLYEIGGITVELNIPNLRSGMDAAIDGRIIANIADMDIITLFIPVIDQAGGRLAANLTLRGVVSDPQFSGDITLSDGLLRHLGSGLRLNDINLAGQIKNNDRANLTGRFRALEGNGDLQAELDLTDFLSPYIQFELKGEDLKLFDADDLTLMAAPDIRLAWRPGEVEIAGKIRIPSAHIAPNFTPRSTVSESPDLVIVAGAPPDAPLSEDEEPDISIRGNLEITLGDDVELDLDYTRAELSGSAIFTWKDELIPIANGQYNLVGQINALGQRLTISRGTIGFPNVKADNPHLNIRAERQIYGNSDIRLAGVFVTGTLRRFALEPFTEPMTTRERARTLLITGSDFNMEEGVGAVAIGAYIAPRVFVSYGIGVFEDENVFSVRYDLGRGWGVKATSGQRESGLDISYTIER